MKRSKLLTLLLAAALTGSGWALAGSNGAVKGNPKSKIYHFPSCAHYGAKGSSVEFQSAAGAEKAGYKPCKQCGAKSDKPAKQSKK